MEYIFWSFIFLMVVGIGLFIMKIRYIRLSDAVREWAWVGVMLVVELLWLMEISNMTTPPDEVNGNGNIAYLLWAPVGILGIYLCIHMYYLWQRLLDWNKAQVKALIGVSVGVIVLGVIGEVWLVSVLEAAFLREGTGHAEHRNTLYFNVWNLLIGLGIGSGLAGGKVWRRVKD